LTGRSRIKNLNNATTSFTDVGKRRIHEDGELGYSFKLSHKDARNKAEIMEHRIKRLLFEEERAQRLSETAK